jgi:hypothetical protein
MADFKPYNWQLDYNYDFVDKNDKKHSPQRFSDSNPLYKIQTDLYPEPHMGNLKDARVVLLGLNPGLTLLDNNEDEFSCEELEWYKENPKVRSILESNLRCELNDYPYYYLNSNLCKCSPGHKWLEARIKELRSEVKLSNKDLSQKIACIQFFPYHTAKYKHSKKYLPSQKHNFQLVLDSIEADKLIVCMRSIKLWDEALLSISDNKIKLSDYENLIQIKNPRSLYFTPNNLKNGLNKIDQSDPFYEIVNLLKMN